MLTIRTEQLALLASKEDDKHLEAAAAAVAAHWPRRAAQLGHEGVLERLRAMQDMAQACGLSDRADMLRLANVSMALDDALGADSPHDWVHATLNNPALRPADRIDVLEGQVQEWLEERQETA